ncbi:DNA glycosylase [Phyllosticta capitalensis]|uniref:Endonuclease III homolog n=1 Tax=Phyllosticta capitalensis TaxID=121624 RepID=A0ABR1YLF0_9PEZI
MRTSRVSRDAALAMRALSSSPRKALGLSNSRSARASAHQTQRVSQAPIKHHDGESDDAHIHAASSTTTTAQTPPPPAADHLSSDLSSVPSDIEADPRGEPDAFEHPSPKPAIEPTSYSTTAAPRKRKRGAVSPGASVSTRTSTTNASSSSTAATSVATRRSSRTKAAPGVAESLQKYVAEESVKLEDAPVSQPKKPRRKPAKATTSADGTLQVDPPADWEQVYNMTMAMRRRILAPVDTMGCETLADEQSSPRDQRLQTLIALMLSSQTKDTVTAAAMTNLRNNLPGGLTLSSLLAVAPPDLNRLIEKVGFHNNKTKYIKATAEVLRDQHDGDIPDTITGLTALPGVGPKMAYLCMSAAWGRDEGIGVDVHVHRITNLWGWHKTRTPEETRAQLEAWLPRDKWHEINWLLVGLGQTVCTPVGRRCGECDLASAGLCPSAVVDRKKKKTTATKVKQEAVVKDEFDDETDVLNTEVSVVVKNEQQIENPIKAESPVGDAVPDMEDLGVIKEAATTRTTRRRAVKVGQ